MDHRLPGRLAQVQREPTLGAIVDDPAIVVRALGHAGPAGAIAVRIAVWRLDLDDVGAEVGHDRGGHGSGDEAGRVDDAHAGEQEVTHNRGRTIAAWRRESSARDRTRADRPATPN